MADITDNAKRIEALGKLFLWLGKNKITIKDLENPLEHFTLLFTSKGFLDAHKTKEGSSKEYESFGLFDLNQFVKSISNPDELEKEITKEIIESVKKVTFDEPQYASYVVANLNMLQGLWSHAKKVKRKVVLPQEVLTEIKIEDYLVPWNKAKGRIAESSIVFDGENFAGWLFQKDDAHYFLSIDTLENTSIGKLLAQLMNVANNDASRQEKQ